MNDFLKVDRSYGISNLMRDILCIGKLHEEDEIILLLMALMLLAFAVQGKVVYRHPRDKHRKPINFFVIIILPSGAGKTRMYMLIFGRHLVTYRKQMEDYHLQNAQYNSELRLFELDIKRLQKRLSKVDLEESDRARLRDELSALEAKRPVAPKAPAALVDDITPAGIRRTLAKRSCFIATTEGSTQLNRTNEDLMAFKCNCWEGVDFEVCDRYHDDPIPSPAFSMLLALQPALFYRYMKKFGFEAIHSGLFPRAFMICRQFLTREAFGQKKYNDFSYLHEQQSEDLSIVEERFHQRIEHIMRQDEQRTLEFSSAAQEALDYYSQQIIANGEYYRERQMNVTMHIDKMHENLRRISALLHVYSEDSYHIEARTVHHAADILNRLFPMQLDFYNPIQGPALEYEAMQVLSWLRARTGYPPQEKRQILRGCVFARDIKTLEQQLKYLEERKYIKIDASGDVVVITHESQGRP